MQDIRYEYLKYSIAWLVEGAMKRCDDAIHPLIVDLDA